MALISAVSIMARIWGCLSNGPAGQDKQKFAGFCADVSGFIVSIGGV